jgi:hypothetical protein
LLRQQLAHQLWPDDIISLSAVLRYCPDASRSGHLSPVGPQIYERYT